MARAVHDLINDLSRRLRDTSASNPVFLYREKHDAIADAMRDAETGFWINGVYESLTPVVGKHGYVLPPYIRAVRLVEREWRSLPAQGASQVGMWEELRSWRHIPSLETNYLWLEANFPAGDRIRVHYEQNIQMLPVATTLTTSVTATASVIPYANSDIPIWQYPVPGYLQVIPGGDIMRYNAITATSFTDVVRGLFGSGTVTATKAFGTRVDSPTLVSAVWPIPFPEAEGYILSRAAQFLLTQRLLNSDNEGTRVYASLAAEWARTAEMQRKMQGMRHQPRTMTSRRQTR